MPPSIYAPLYIYDMRIRPILPQDNAQVQHIIQHTILEYGAPKKGTAYSDIATTQMYEHYQKPRRAYWVIESDAGLVGCGGIGPLEDFDHRYCELQKMYFLPVARGKGLGKRLIELCLAFAKAYQFKFMYLETMSNMIEAQGLYKRMGFTLLDKPLGNTGHFSCPVQMLKPLHD